MGRDLTVCWQSMVSWTAAIEARPLRVTKNLVDFGHHVRDTPFSAIGMSELMQLMRTQV